MKMSIFSLLSRNLIGFFLLINFYSFSQQLQVEIVGGNVVTQGSTITINAGSNLQFRMTNVESGNCKNLKIKSVTIANTVDFQISPNNPKGNIKPYGCKGGKKYRDFEIENKNSNCVSTSTLVTIKIKNQSDFTFTLQVNSSSEIYVLGGSPAADIFHGDITTSDTNGTYFGVVDAGNTVTHAYIVANIGSCDLDITGVSSSNTDFYAYSPYGLLPPTITLPSYYYTVIYVTFTAPVAGTGTQSSVISISNTDNTTFTFTVSAEMFNENIPGPGGITTSFKLWLKSTRGIVKTGSTLTTWQDLGTNGKDATTVSGKEPTYLDTATDDINFNPVVKFQNDGASIEQYMYNADTPLSGFYNHDIFIVMIPDATMNGSSTRNTIFAGVDSGNTGDMTGIGFGDYSTRFTNETISYNQDVPGGGSYNGEAEIGSSYSNAGIINIRNDAASSPTKQDILYNSSVLSTSNVSDVAFTNISASKYWLGRNQDAQGSLNGRVAEVFTFGQRLSNADRQKVESYLAIKYGITLGASNEAQKDYVNSFDTKVWDITANAGFNYDVAGIGRDSISDLNQKQSKSINYANAVTIGLGGLFDTNSANPNELSHDGDFLVWGNNNGAFSGTNTNTVTVATGITTSLTRIDRKWKIVESEEFTSGSEVETVYVSIPAAAFSGFSKLASEEYALIVADNPNFNNADIIDVIPLRSEDGGVTLQTWYDFHGTKYFTFGKVAKLTENHSVSLATGDYLVGEYSLNLSVDSFTISAWIKSASNASTRTIMAKGEKLQLRLNSSDQVEVMIDDTVTPKYVSNMTIGDNKWHQITFIYDSASIFLYVDGILDKSVQDVVHPSPNYNNFSIGVIYLDKNTVLNPFIGSIDEVYVWDVALTENQIWYLMNQEIERIDVSGTDYINGKILPYNASNNAVATIPWSSLRVYYDFNSFYGSTVEGLTDDRFFLRLKYLNKDKTLLNSQTIPVPYQTAADGLWDNASTWVNGSDIVLPNTLGLNGNMIDNNIVEISHNVSSGDRDISLLGLIQTTGKLTIADPNETQDETNSGQGLTISNYLELDGIIDLVGESQLVQTEGSIIDADSGGYIERDQQGTANGFNYNYWSSSVGPIGGNTATRGTGIEATNANYTIAGVLNDGTNSAIYQNLLYSSNPNGSGSIPPPGLPQTISTYWLYKFYGTAGDYYSWAKIDETSSLLPGEGFTMKGTSGAVTITTQQNYVFEGLPNNGDITLALDKSSGDVNRLIGNPYPSAIDATEFILDNLSVADGGNNTSGTIFNGALYFWDHFGEENSHVLKDYVGGYATRNLIGGAAAISNDSRINNNGAIGTKVPGQYIPVNQGFFVSTALDGFNNDNGTPILTVDGGTIVFKNSQRVFDREDGSTSLFLKSSSKKSKNSNATLKKGEPSLIKLQYSSALGYHRQLVLGTNKNASINFDIGYDAIMADVNKEDMYWAFNKSKLVIQGVNNFNAGQEFPLGLIVKEGGTINIKIDDVENMDKNKPIYIKDNLTGETYQINNSPYEIYLEPGTYEDRFKLVFQSENKALSNDEVELTNKVLVFYNSESSALDIVLKDATYVFDGAVINLFGQKINSIKAFEKQISIPIEVSTGTYVIQLKTDKGIVNKKIIIQ